MTTAEVQAHRLTQDEYSTLVAAHPERYERSELLDGLIYDTMGEGTLHSELCESIASKLRSQYGPRQVKTTGTVSLARSATAVDPDVWVRYSDLPHDLVLEFLMNPSRFWPATQVHEIIEVATSTYMTDRNEKLPRYARDGIAKVTIVTADGAVIYTDPRSDGTYATEQAVPLETLLDWDPRT